MFRSEKRNSLETLKKVFYCFSFFNNIRELKGNLLETSDQNAQNLWLAIAIS